MRMMRGKAFVCTVFCLAILLGSMIWATPYLTSGEGLIKLRNALLVQPGVQADFQWLPGHEPAGYQLETLSSPESLRNIVAAIPVAEGSNLDRTLSVARHLLQFDKRGPSVKNRTEITYQAMVSAGRGYCADYTQVFNALAYTLDIPVREWGFAHSEFGGGHGFSEFYDDTLKQWVFIDIFNSFYVSDRDGRPLSVQEFRQFLLTGQREAVKIHQIRPIRFGFRDEQNAWDYYASGADQMFMWWGTNIVSYEANPIVAAFSFSRSAEQLAAIALGIHPKMRVLPDHISAPDLQIALSRKRTLLFWLVGDAIAFSIIVGVVIYSLRARSSALQTRRVRKRPMPSPQ